MTDKLSTPNHAETGNSALQPKYRKDEVLAAIFCFAYLKMKDTTW